ncbi:MAG: class III signal peptide-containing protein [archaeon]|nr:class III signal peptide-containing protein [archaeon]
MRNGQGALEYLLILGAAVLIIAIAIVVVLNLSGDGLSQIGDIFNGSIFGNG